MLETWNLPVEREPGDISRGILVPNVTLCSSVISLILVFEPSNEENVIPHAVVNVCVVGEIASSISLLIK